MMKRIIFILGLGGICAVFLISSVIQQKISNKIAWHEDRKLSWSNFKGVVPISSTRAAISYLYTSYDMNIKDSILYINTTCYFDELKSKKRDYVKKGEKTFLLNHEELHFDIGEIHQRIERKAIMNAKFKSLDDIVVKISHILDSLENNVLIYHEVYDEETNHSKIEAGQLEWNKKVPLMLDSLKAYSDPIIQIDLREIVARSAKN